jgi:hypothetical protein
VPVSLEALRSRIQELEQLANEVFELAEQVRDGRPAQEELSRNGQRWYRGARAFLVENESSGIAEFDACYDTSKRPDADRGGGRRWRSPGDIEDYITSGPHGATGKPAHDYFTVFSREFRKARALVIAVVDEVASRLLSLRSQLSYEVAADELDAADALLANWEGHEAFMRAAGVVARVALERHLFTLADTKGVQIVKNPPTKPRATADDAVLSLQRANVITALQKRRVEDLLAVGNACAHPRDTVTHDDVRRLITEGKQIAAVLV